jgi:hypothetical protein
MSSGPPDDRLDSWKEVAAFLGRGVRTVQRWEREASSEMLMPAYLPGTAPIATPNQIILVLGDFRGDVWLMDV